uniref:Uncharacterized protein n=1 Tax=Plectus sambesii TaxID=2011161 RepID=A0A914WZV8_9BILA
AGSLIGGLVLGPLMKLMVKNPDIRQRLSRRMGIRGAAIGLLVGPAMTYARISAGKLDHDGLYDRCYRLRHNHWQLIFDRMTYIGALAGGAMFGLTGIPLGINLALVSVFAFKNGIPLWQSTIEPLVSNEGAQSQPTKSASSLPTFNVKDVLKTPKEAYTEAYKGDCKASLVPGVCACPCHSNRCRCG